MKTILWSFLFILLLIRTALGQSFDLPASHCSQDWKKKGLNWKFKGRSKPLTPYTLNQDYRAFHKNLARKNCRKDWTVLIYMAADNDLTPYAFWDIYEIEKNIKGELNLGASSENIDVIIELDTYARSGARRYHLFQGEKEYNNNLKVSDFNSVDEDIIESPLIRAYKETGPGTLRNQKYRFDRFLSWAFKEYPSEKTMVIIWGHGEGYISSPPSGQPPRRHSPLQIPKRTSRFPSIRNLHLDYNLNYIPKQFPLKKSFGGIAFDFSETTYLSIPDLAEAINSNLEKYRGGKPLDSLVLDACLMQSLEVAYELKDSSEILVGSNQIQNYLGLPYRKLLDQLNQSPLQSGYDISIKIPKMAKVSFSKQGYQGKADPKGGSTLVASTLSLHEIQNYLIPGLEKLSRSIQDYILEDELRAEDIAFILEASPKFPGETRDLGVTLGYLLELIYQEAEFNGSLSPQAIKLKNTIDYTLHQLSRSLLAYEYGEHYAQNSLFTAGENYLLGYFRGLSLWLPSDYNLYQARIDEHRHSSFHQERQQWGLYDWLESILRLPFLADS